MLVVALSLPVATLLVATTILFSSKLQTLIFSQLIQKISDPDVTIDTYRIDLLNGLEFENLIVESKDIKLKAQGLEFQYKIKSLFPIEVEIDKLNLAQLSGSLNINTDEKRKPFRTLINKSRKNPPLEAVFLTHKNQHLRVTYKRP